MMGAILLEAVDRRGGTKSLRGGMKCVEPKA